MKTTKKDFEIFKKEFLRWVDIFGLKGYGISFVHTHKQGSIATIKVNEEGKVAVISLTDEVFGIDADEFDAAENAKHEAMHLLLNKICHIGSCRYVNEGELEDEWERLVRVLEKIL